MRPGIKSHFSRRREARIGNRIHRTVTAQADNVARQTIQKQRTGKELPYSFWVTDMPPDLDDPAEYILRIGHAAVQIIDEVLPDSGIVYDHSASLRITDIHIRRQTEHTTTPRLLNSVVVLTQIGHEQ